MIAQPPAALTLAGFVLTAAAVVYAGVRLARHGDVIAARSRWGPLWVGSLFLAIATSLPELTTDIAAVRLGAVDLAAGDIFGSSMANMLILALLSLIPGAELFRRAALDNGLAASLAITLTATAALAVMIRSTGSILGLGYGSLVLGTGYVIGMRAVYRNTALVKRAVEVEEMASPAAPSLRSASRGARTGTWRRPRSSAISIASCSTTNRAQPSGLPAAGSDADAGVPGGARRRGAPAAGPEHRGERTDRSCLIAYPRGAGCRRIIELEQADRPQTRVNGSVHDTALGRQLSIEGPERGDSPCAKY
jgi:Ca2+/Na+ antiporter